MSHLGRPCIHCGVADSDVAAGACPRGSGLAAIHRNIAHWNKLLEAHEREAAAKSAGLRQQIAAATAALNQVSAGLDLAQIELAESVMHVSGYTGYGEQRDAIKDAIQWFATGEAGCRGLRYEFFGAKDYDRWSSQRCDCSYGFGPRHGSIVFAIGLHPNYRGESGDKITDAQRDACIYYLMNIKAIQASRVTARIAPRRAGDTPQTGAAPCRRKREETMLILEPLVESTTESSPVPELAGTKHGERGPRLVITRVGGFSSSTLTGYWRWCGKCQRWEKAVGIIAAIGCPKCHEIWE